MTRPYKPENIPGLMPYLFVSDPKASLDFYEKTFGFKPDGEPMKQGDQIIHAEMTFLDTKIMLGQEGAWGSPAKTPKNSGIPPGMGLYVYCQDVDGQFEKIKSAGGEVMGEPETMFWGDRMFRAADPDGYHWTFATNVADFDPSKIPDEMKQT